MSRQIQEKDIKKAYENVEELMVKPTKELEDLMNKSVDLQPILFSGISEMLESDDYWQEEISVMLMTVMEAARIAKAKLPQIPEEAFMRNLKLVASLVEKDVDESKLKAMEPFARQPIIFEYFMDELCECGIEECSDEFAGKIACTILSLQACLAEFLSE